MACFGNSECSVTDYSYFLFTIEESVANCTIRYAFTFKINDSFDGWAEFFVACRKNYARSRIFDIASLYRILSLWWWSNHFDMSDFGLNHIDAKIFGLCDSVCVQIWASDSFWKSVIIVDFVCFFELAFTRINHGDIEICAFCIKSS